MNRKMSTTILSFTIVAFALAGCGPSPEEIATMTASAWTPTPLPTNTPAPTDTPEPTATPTPEPTATLEPTATFTPEPTVPPTVRDDAGNVIIPQRGKIRIAALDNIDMFQDVLFVGAALAVEDFGPIHGFEVELVEIDDFCFEETIQPGAVTAAEDSTIVAVVGPFCSQPALASLPVFEEAKIVMVSPTATRPDLPGAGPNVFNRVILDEEQKAATGTDESAFLEVESVQELLGRVGEMPDVPPENIDGFGVFYALSYDATSVLLAAIRNSAVVGGDGSLTIDWQALAQAVRSTQDYEGVTGPITIDDRGNRVP